jgi:hypothetical protein
MHQLGTARRGDRIRPLSVLGLVALAVGSVGAGAITLALLTSSAITGGNAFTVGTIVIGLSPSSALLTMSGMLPGDSTNGTLTVSNSGTGTLRYAVTTAATDPDGKTLRDQMTLVIRTKDSNTAGCGNFNGTQLYSGTLAAGAIGDPTAGAQAGDRTLAAAASEILCFRAALPSGTGIGYQGAATSATFTFAAEQTANNP